ncbi:MAG: ATP-grasp domain-containing protein [Lentisphaeria bacterium]|nr:ATP-grasp domain-containing protein [Lentisphaeria bacterium]
MNQPDPVIVVGTTTDYIDWIRDARPGQTLFLTDTPLRQEATEPAPGPGEEILCDLTDADGVFALLVKHLAAGGRRPAGIACFDCENMLLTADLARRLDLPYPSASAVRNCRSKLASKQLWQPARVPCPRFQVARTAAEAQAFAQSLAGPCVIKPISGAGSELTFRCDSPVEARACFEQVKLALDDRKSLPMFNQVTAGPTAALMEEWIDGIEYSCDFVIDKGAVTIVRMARKYALKHGLFGITAGYELLPDSGPFNAGHLREHLARGAAALGLERAFCMVDLIDQGGIPCFLEMAPRPGGDCLPWLLRRAAGVDVMGAYLDFCAGRPATPRPRVAPWLAVRLFADRGGVLRHIDTSELNADPRVRDIYLKRHPGDKIELPPGDYDSWILGHVVYEPDPRLPVDHQNDKLAAMVRIKWD